MFPTYLLESDRPGVTMHPAQPDQCQNRWFVKISKVSYRLPKIMLILKNLADIFNKIHTFILIFLVSVQMKRLFLAFLKQ